MPAVSTRRGCQLRAVAGPWLDALPFSQAGPFAFLVQPVRFLSHPVLAQESSGACDSEVWEPAQENIRAPGRGWGPASWAQQTPSPLLAGSQFPAQPGFQVSWDVARGPAAPRPHSFMSGDHTRL